jgi:glycine/D-amino acid oxidase-like deaminating enzyme
MRHIDILPQDDTTNGWFETLAERSPKPALRGEVLADWIVVGAGLTGLAAARRLAMNRPDDKVVVLDAQRVGDAASGRNSGFIIDVSHSLGASDTDGLEVAKRAMRLSRAAIAFHRENVTRQGIDCQWQEGGQYLCAVSGESETDLERHVAEFTALGEPHRVLGRADLSREVGTEYYRAAVHTPGTVLVQPVALIRGLADTLPENVTLYEGTPVTSIEYGDRIQTHTPHGRVDGAQIVLAVGGYAPHFAINRDRLFTLGLFASMTHPLNAEQRRALGGKGGWGILPVNTFAGATMRFTHDHRLLFRQSIAYNARFRTDEATRQRVRRQHEVLFRARFPMLAEVTFEHTWVGYVSLSKNFAPAFGRYHRNVYAADCLNSLGLSHGTAVGMLTADFATGNDNSLIADLEALGQPVRLPPRPFVDLGASAALAWWKWRGRREQ